MHDNNPHLRGVTRTMATAEPAPADDDAGLPSVIDGAYAAHARPANRPLYSIHFVSPGGEVRSFQYAHLDSDSRLVAGRFTLSFLGMEPVRVAVSGRNLWRLYDLIHQHRVAWVAEAARDFAEDGKTIVTQVTTTPVDREG